VVSWLIVRYRFPGVPVERCCSPLRFSVVPFRSRFRFPFLIFVRVCVLVCCRCRCVVAFPVGSVLLVLLFAVVLPLRSQIIALRCVVARCIVVVRFRCCFR